MLLYDITNKESLKQIETMEGTFYESIGNYKNSKYIIILIRNKKDLINEEGFQREVTEDETKATCEKKKFPIWHGEYNELLKLFAEYFKDIYDKVGDKVIERQVSKSLEKFQKLLHI